MIVVINYNDCTVPNGLVYHLFMYLFNLFIYLIYLCVHSFI